MAHCIVPEAEAILDNEFKVLDKGFVRLVDYLGSDSRIVQAARVSYGEGTKSYREDKGLIDYLLRNDHTSPFEQVVFTFHVKLPIFVARQWIRHRTARLNEISGRYSVMKSEFYVPAEADISLQSDNNKQGRSTEEVSPELRSKVLDILKSDHESVYKHYEELLGHNVARELARVNLPLSTYTEWYWQIDLHNLFHFLRLRMDGHAQKEIRDYADIMHEISAKVCPMAFEAFDTHIKGGTRLGRGEVAALKMMLEGKDSGLDERGLRILKEKLGISI